MPNTETPVYLIAGFLDSGKTSFINGILSDGFAMEDRTMLLCCEEGEVEYDPQLLRNVTVVTVDDPEELTPEFLEDVKRKGQYLREGIEGLNSPYVSGIRGMGLMVGVGVQGMTHKELKDKLMAEGLLCLTAGKDTLRLLPPLVITREEIDKGLEIMARVMK